MPPVAMPVAQPKPLNTPPVGPTNARGFSTVPTAAYSCFDPCPDGASLQVPEYIPFLFTPFYKRVRIPGYGVDSLINGCIPSWKGGYCKIWWFVKCFGFDVIKSEEEAEFLPAKVNPTGDALSMLKLLVIGFEYGRYKAEFIFDIGTRIDVNLGAYQRLEAYVLVPDLDRYIQEGGVLPADPLNAQDFRAKSLVVPSAVGVEALGGFKNGTYTQSLYLHDVDQPTQIMDIPHGAKLVSVLTNDPTAPTPILTYFLDPGLPIPVAVVAGGGTIPENSKQVQVAMGVGDAGPRVVTLTFLLDV